MKRALLLLLAACHKTEPAALPDAAPPPIVDAAPDVVATAEPADAGGPSVRIVSVSVTTVADALPISDLVPTLLPKFQLCYLRGRSTSPTLAGPITLRVVVDGAGAAKAAPDAGAPFADPSVRSCMLDVLAGAHFPQSEGNVVTVELMLSSGWGDEALDLSGLDESGGLPRERGLAQLSGGMDAGKPRGAILRQGPISLGGPGRLPSEVIARIVRQNWGRFRLCYEKGLAKTPTLAGKVTIVFSIDHNGNVASVADNGSDLADKDVVACVQRPFSTMSFPQPEGSQVDVTYSLNFSPPDLR